MPLQCPPRLLISIHPPRKGRDRTAPKSFPPLEEFQSTLPARGGTPERPTTPEPVGISIHPPRGGRDTHIVGEGARFEGFQSTLPVGGGTPTPWQWISDDQFQSTLPVGGGTLAPKLLGEGPSDFNPPSPWGEGPTCSRRPGIGMLISIHPPRGGRDVAWSVLVWYQLISIHPPRGGRD